MSVAGTKQDRRGAIRVAPRLHAGRGIDRERRVRSGEADALPQRSAAKRRDVLTAAWDMFAQRGFGRTSMRDLAAEAGVSTATIYAHFPTKQELLRALVAQRWEEALIGMVQGAAEVDDPLERLLFAIIGLNRAIAADPLLRQLLVTPRRVGDVHIDKQIGSIEDMMDARCAEAIRAAIMAKRLKCQDPDALAVLIRVSMQGWLLTESKRKRPMSEARMTGSLVDLLRAARPTAERATRR